MTQTNDTPVELTPAEVVGLNAALIRKNIAAISVKCPTTARAVIDRYHRHVSPSMGRQGDAEFPVHVNPHIRNGERSRTRGQFNLICFYIGNALLAYYDCVGKEKPEPSPALIRRCLMLKAIADNDLKGFETRGDVSTGYYLHHPIAEAALKDYGGCANEVRKSNVIPATTKPKTG